MLSRQQKEAEAIQQSTQLGLLLVDKKGFKDKFASSLRSRLEVRHSCDPKLADMFVCSGKNLFNN